MTLVSIEVVFYSKKFETAKFWRFFNFSIFELVQAYGNKRKSHRLKGGCYKWWASVCYLRTNLDKLRWLSDWGKKLTFNKKQN